MNLALTTSMTYRELAHFVKTQGPVDVTFNQGANDMEDYPSEGIRGRIENIKDDNHPSDTDNPDEIVLKVTINYKGFEVLNSLMETADYYDYMRKPRLRAYASGNYKQKELLFVMATDPIGRHIANIVPAPHHVTPALVETALNAIALR